MKTVVQLLAAFILLSLPAAAVESRIALLMGVGNYGNNGLHSLPGIDEDLRAMSTALRQVGFEVTVVSDPTLAQAEDAIDTFGARLRAKEGVGLFYFSGHGGEFEGKNYLIPRGARLGEVRDIKEQAIAAQRVLNRMESSGARVSIVFLDCCRNDMTKAATDSGLAAMSARGTFIGFATASEKVSAATNRGSPYTQSLARHIPVPGLSILDMHTLVTAEVQDYTKSLGDEQIPYSYSGLRSPFFFVEKESTPLVATGTDAALAVGDIVENYRHYDAETNRFVDGSDSKVRGTKWKIVEITKSYVDMELVSGLYVWGYDGEAYKYPGFRAKFDSSYNYRRQHPGRDLNDETLREWRKP